MFGPFRFSILFLIFIIFVAHIVNAADAVPNEAAVKPPVNAPPPPSSDKTPPEHPPAPKPPTPKPEPHPKPQPEPHPKPGPEPHPKPEPKPEPKPLVCDTPSDNTLTVYGVAKKWEKSDDPVYYLSPGLSYCKENYTDQSNVVCVSSGHFPNQSQLSCQEWVQVTNKESGVVSFGRILDQCGDVPNSTFGCNDIYLSRQMFIELAGKDSKGALDVGHLTQIEWRKVIPPCWGTYAGLPGKYPNGTEDSGFGQDSNGFLRCGRMRGEERVVGADVDKVCNVNIKDCKEAMEIRKTLPKYDGGKGVKSADHQPKAVAYNAENFKLIKN